MRDLNTNKKTDTIGKAKKAGLSPESTKYSMAKKAVKKIRGTLT